MTGQKHYSKKHNTYGGEIDIKDFDTNSPYKKRISKQVEANNLYLELDKKRKEKNDAKKYKHMTLEELREMKVISNTNDRPVYGLTNEKWQKEFNVRKIFIKPLSNDIKKMGGKFSNESGMWNEETQGTYHGVTNWQQYCSYINDVLKNIQSGQTDYCYFIYQVMDLAKFHYNTLKTRYCDGYWEVWLEG